MVAAAFADEGVVKLLTRKMQLCKEAEGAILNSKGKEAAARRRGGAAGAAAEGARKEPPGGLGQEKRSNDVEIVRGKKVKPSSARPLEEKNAQGFPRGHECGPSARADSVQRRLRARGRDDEPRILLSQVAMPMFAINPSAKPETTVAVRTGLGEDTPTFCIDGWDDGCLDRQGRQVTKATARANEASGVDAEGGLKIVDATVEKDGGTHGLDQDQECSPLLGAGRDDCPSPSYSDLGSNNRPGGLAQKKKPNEDHPHRGGSGDDPPNVVGGANNAIREAEGREPSAAPAGNAPFPSPSGVLLESQFDAVEEDHELGLILSSFERKLERGAALVRDCGEPSDVGEAEEENDHPESGCAEVVSSSSLCSEESRFSGRSNNGSDDTAGQGEATHAANPEVAGGVQAKIGSPKIFASDADREREESTRNKKNEGALSPGPNADALGERGDSANRSLVLAAGERKLSPETATTEDEDNEDYDFTFDDDDLVPGHKTVQFTDESRWSVHEVRESFQQHELGELFYSTAELDVMQEEAELEEALERSKAIASQKEEALEKGGGSLLLSLGGNSAQKREASGGDVETASSESLFFDCEGSEYSF